jgi:V/A-type H+-transporting ATPase subunit E
MAEELQHLLDTIQRDGIEKAEAEANRMVSEAEKRSQQIVREGEDRAQEIRSQTERDAKAYHDRTTRAIEQAARDVLISTGQGIEEILRECVRESVGEALTSEVLKEILLRMATLYLELNVSGGPVDLYLNEKDEKALGDYFTAALRDKMNEGVEIHPSSEVSKGFKISFRDHRLYHDFTHEAIADEMCRYLQPRIQEIVRRVVDNQEGKR